MNERIFCYVLVDLENVRPVAAEIGRLPEGCRVLVFARSSARITVDLARSLRDGRGEFILIEHSGKNALDFHIACTLGMLSREAPTCAAYVISRDTGYDSVIAWLNGHTGIRVARLGGFHELPVSARGRGVLETPPPPPVPAPPPPGLETLQKRAAHAIAYLNLHPATRPRTRRALKSALNNCFRHKLSEKQVKQVIRRLAAVERCISFDPKDNVSYLPPLSVAADNSGFSGNKKMCGCQKMLGLFKRLGKKLAFFSKKEIESCLFI